MKFVSNGKKWMKRLAANNFKVSFKFRMTSVEEVRVWLMNLE